MRKLHLFTLFLISYVLNAQTIENINIDWQEKSEMAIGKSKIMIPRFIGNNFHYDTEKKCLFFTLKLKQSAAIKLTDIILNNLIYESVTKEQLGDLSLENIPTETSVNIQNYINRGIVESFLTFSPIIKDDSGFKRIKSFSYRVSNITSKSNTINTTKAIVNSVLSTGDWRRFYIEKSGVYKISQSFLKEIGVELNGIDLKKIKLYGNGGKMLPLTNNIEYPNDPTEIALQLIDGNDGSFDVHDYILFYGEGVDRWNEESQTNLNLYDSKSYYYITTSGDNGKRITNMNQPSEAATLDLTTFDDYQYHENDFINIAHLGRQWFGESFDINQEQEFEFNFPNVDLSNPLKIKVVTASAAYTTTSFQVSANGQNIGNINFPAINTNSDAAFFVRNLTSNSSVISSENVKIKLSYNNNGVPGSKGYLDNIQLFAKRKLVGYGKQFHFQYNLSNTESGTVKYSFTNANGIAQVWDVTDLFNVTKVENNDQNTFSFKARLGETRKYIAIDALDYYTTSKDAKPKITNQNIKGTIFSNEQGEFQDIDYVIITPNELKNQAEKLIGRAHV